MAACTSSATELKRLYMVCVLKPMLSNNHDNTEINHWPIISVADWDCSVGIGYVFKVGQGSCRCVTGVARMALPSAVYAKTVASAVLLKTSIVSKSDWH